MHAETVRPNPEKSSWKKKLVAGAGLIGGNWALDRGVDSLSIAGAATGVLEPLVRNHPMWVLGLMVGVFTFAAGVNAAQNMRLLRDKDVGVSPNGIATVAFHTVDKKLSSKKRLRKLSMRLIGAGQVASAEHLAIAPALGNEMVLAGLVANTAVKTILNLAKAGASEVILRTKKKEKGIKENNHKDLRSTVIFTAPVAVPSVAAGD